MKISFLKLPAKKEWWLAQAPWLVIVLLCLIVAITNYRSNTWLSGWDTLHPEFNLNLYFQRVFFGAWQEHQALGAPAAQAHTAELTRLPLYWILSAILPAFMVRYSFFILMYLSGGLGTYIFIRNSWFKHTKTPMRSWAASVGAVFYLFNLGTLQHFYVPLEMFAVHFATLGWVLWSLHAVIEKPTTKHLAIFFGLQLLSAASAHTATLFYMYMSLVGIYAVIICISKYGKSIWSNLKILLMLASLVLAAQSFWLGPNLYYVAAHSDYVKNARISQNFSAEAFWQNQAYGTTRHLGSLKNFLFNWQDYHFSRGNFVDLFDEWKNYQDNNGSLAWIYTLSILMVIGIIVSFNRRQRSHSLAILLIASIALFFIINLNPPFTSLFTLLRSNTMLDEALRFPFTKFSIVLIFCLSVYLAQWTYHGLDFFQNVPARKKLYQSGFVGIMLALILSPQWPALSGNLISSQMKITIPSAYFSLFDWYEKQPKQIRVLKLPAHTYWGWTYQQWPTQGTKQGYQGAGFTWFGIPQPTLDREFDRWVETNEVLYHQLTQALYNRSATDLATLFRLYNIHLVLVDESVIIPGGNSTSLFIPEIKSLLSEMGISLIWQEQFLSVYAMPTLTTRFISAPASYVTASQQSYNTHVPIAYTQLGSFIDSKNDQAPDYQFPLSDFLGESITDLHFTENTISKQVPVKNSAPAMLSLPMVASGSAFTTTIKVKYQDNQLSFDFPEAGILTIDQTKVLLPALADSRVELPASGSAVTLMMGNVQTTIQQQQTSNFFVTLPVNQTISLTVVTDDLPPTFYTLPSTVWQNTQSPITASLMPGDHWLTVTLPKTGFEIQLDQLSSTNCDIWKRGTIKQTQDLDGVTYEVDNYGTACTTIDLQQLSTQAAYLLRWKGTNHQGRSLKFSVTNQHTQHLDLEVLLPSQNFDVTYTLPAWDKMPDSFYTLSWETRSFGQPAQTTLSNLEIMAAPLEYLAHLKLSSQSPTIHHNQLTLTNLWKIASYQYGFIASSPDDNGLVSLSQSFDKGWIALAWPQTLDRNFHFRILPHTRYNGWANAWSVPTGTWQITLLYLPQLTIFAGSGLGLATGIYFIKSLIRRQK